MRFTNRGKPMTQTPEMEAELEAAWQRESGYADTSLPREIFRLGYLNGMVAANQQEFERRYGTAEKAEGDTQ